MSHSVDPSPNHDGATNIDAAVSSPLSWEEARLTLRHVMETYMETPLPVVKSPKNDEKVKSKPWELLFEWNVDFYVGALVSAALLGMSIAALVTRKNGGIGMNAALNAAANLTVYRAQVAGSTLLLVGSFFSIFLVKRREYSFARDSDVSKRKTIKKYLRSALDENSKYLTSSVRSNGEESTRSSAGENTGPKVPQLHHSGTSRTGIYPAYRRSENEDAFWYRIPVLLLAKGDIIALQVGDVAPARCMLLSSDSLRSKCTIEGGEMITASTFGDLWGLSPCQKFPPGKSTVPSNSCKLMELCNNMSLFVLEETPLEPFLRLPNGTSNRHAFFRLHRFSYLIFSLLFQRSRGYHSFIDNFVQSVMSCFCLQ